MIALVFLFASALAITNQCNTDGDTTACCTDALGSELCGNITWVPAQQAIKVSSSFGALQLLSYTFTQNNTNACVQNGFAKFCFAVNNFTVDATGCCGCLASALDLGPVQISETIGCFAFGVGTNCPNTDCSTYSSCGSCDVLPNCGFCANAQGTGVCMEGTQNGPTSGSCSGPNNTWVDHLQQCRN